jgi:hypothetical protein
MIREAVNTLVEHTRKLISEGSIVPSEPCRYNHMGATITDGILQAGLSYYRVVLPRVKLVQSHPEADTTSGFLKFIEMVSLDHLLAGANGKPFSGKKSGYIRDLSLFLQRRAIETEEQFADWLRNEDNGVLLRAQKGIGPKTLDYFKILVGLDASAIDVHLTNFIAEAGISAAKYEDCQDLVNQCADQLGVAKANLDYGIWRYMGAKSRGRKRNG